MPRGWGHAAPKSEGGWSELYESGGLNGYSTTKPNNLIPSSVTFSRKGLIILLSQSRLVYKIVLMH